MKYSISNLAWADTPLDQIIPKLALAGVQGVEIAPTAIWPNLNLLSDQEIVEFKKYLESENLVVSGIQSLLYGHPELQLFDQACWGDLRKHLENVIRIGGLLGADVAVFGSPTNRLRGNLESHHADELAEIFLKQIIPTLHRNEIVLTLEPNAPDYGSDYLTTYEEVLKLSQRIDSKNIKPQIDTGCLWMVDKSPEKAYEMFTPHHIHLSTPNLGQVPGNFNFEPLLNMVKQTNFDGWVVIEMLNKGMGGVDQILDSLNWLTGGKEEFSNAD